MKLLTLFLLLTFSLNLKAITKNEIQNSGNYYYGAGESETFGEAKDIALSNLTKQIAVKVATSFERNIKENSKGLDKSAESIIKTHSSATLKNVETIKNQTADGLLEVFCFLKKSEVEKIFDERKKLIEEMCYQAKNYSEAGNLAYSLKLYYFASILLKSIPEQNITYRGINFTTEIPKRINEIILDTDLQFSQSERISSKEKNVTLLATYKNKPVSFLDFTFWDGKNQILVNSKDGFANFKLLGSSADFSKLALRIKYSYYESRKEFSVVEDLWDLVTRPSFKSDKTVLLKKENEKILPKRKVVRDWNLTLNSDGKAPVEAIKNSTIKFLELISKGSKNEIEKAFTKDDTLRGKVLAYQKFNNPRFPPSEIEAEIHKTESGFELRKIQVSHSYPSLNKQSTEFLVLDFSEKGELVDVNASINETLYGEFVNQAEFGEDWSERQEIIKFVERYRTAYLTRDIETIDLMFAEDALILVGRQIKRKPLAKAKIKYQEIGNQPNYETIKLTKTEFIGRQTKIFKSNRDIFLDFGSFEIIKKANSDKIYGVEMRQSYASSNYSDEGYLFLLIDFNEENPTIYVRAWQPNEWDKEALVKTSNFRVNR